MIGAASFPGPEGRASKRRGARWVDSRTPALKCRCHRHLPGPRVGGLLWTGVFLFLAARGRMNSFAHRWERATPIALMIHDARSESRAPGKDAAQRPLRREAGERTYERVRSR